MADTVRYLMEDMIPELEDLEKKGYFSRSEIKQIVQKRQDFEYLLKRRSALKTDFYRYIAYEVKLEELRRHRKQALGIKGKKGPAEVSGVRRVHFIYERATRKFKADLELWLRWVEFCKDSKSSKQLSKVVTKALQRHAMVSSLWIEAAVWEFEHNANVSAARSLMQQGLRNCKQDEQMWTEYVRMELLYVQKLRLRRRILGVENPPEGGAAAVTTNATATDAADAADVIADAATIAAAPAPSSTPAAITPGSLQAAEAATAEVLRGGVARLAASTALAAMPHSLTLRKQLLATFCQFRFPGMKHLRQLVFDDLAQRFSEDPAAWALRARRHAPPAGASFDAVVHAKVCAAFDEAVAALTRPAMYEEYISYLSEVLQPLLDAGEAQVEAAVAVGAQLLSAFQASHNANACSEALYLAWVDKASSLAQRKLALVAVRAACERLPSSAALWERRIALEVQRLHRRAAAASSAPGAEASAAASGMPCLSAAAGNGAGKGTGANGSAAKEEAALMSTISAAVRAVSTDDAAATVWMQAVNALAPASSSFAGLCDLLLHSLSNAARGPNRGDMGHVAAAFVQKIRDSMGLEPARNFYRRVQRGPCPGADFYRAVIQLEEQEWSKLHGSSHSHISMASPGALLPSPPDQQQEQQQKQQQEQRISALYEAALASYGDCAADLWLAYARQQQACQQGGGLVYWRATKALQDPAQFVEDYRTALVSAV